MIYRKRPSAWIRGFGNGSIEEDNKGFRGSNFGRTVRPVRSF